MYVCNGKIENMSDGEATVRFSGNLNAFSQTADTCVWKTQV